MDDEKEETTSVNLTELKESLINHVCMEKRTFFRHQQKNEEEIGNEEKQEIVSGILSNSHTRFLSRFGMVLKKEHLAYFESENQCELIKEQIKNLKFNLDHERTIVKNRRYAAMLKLISENEYFSEYEMERRNPLLYNDLVGKYFSPAEKAKKSRPNIQDSTLVDVLLDKIDRDETSENVRRQQELEGEDSRESFEDEQSDTEPDKNLWGNFDNETRKISKENKSRKRQADLLITAGERDILREEFIGIMYNEFLCGHDTEFFDYSQVDYNEQYDEVLEKDQDCEDKYFEDDSLDNSQENGHSDKNDESEDELDIYMKHIEEHIKKQKKDSFHEEFEDD